MANGHAHIDEGKMPLLLNELNPEHSKGIAVGQYLSSLLAGTVSRLRLIYELDDCLSFKDRKQLPGPGIPRPSCSHSSVRTSPSRLLFCSSLLRDWSC